MDQWLQVFKTGTHTDSSGDTKDWTAADLDKIISQYDPSKHEAPLVIGHPQADAPAFGWVEALKRDGEYLLAKFKSLVPEFVEMVKKGLFKKRSISLYPDLTLRHIGFLGAAAPAVKGLADIKFREREQTAIDFSDFEDNINFEEGGLEMGKSAKDDLERELQRRINEVLRNPPGFDKRGNKFSERPTYREALTYVWEEDPDLAQRHAEAYRRRPSGRVQDFDEAAGEKIMELVQAKMRNDKTLCYNEALVKVQLENPQLIREYLIPDQTRRHPLSQMAKVVLNYMAGSPKPHLPLMASKIKMVADLARDLLAADPTLTKINAITTVLEDHPDLTRDLVAGGKNFDL